QEDDPDGETGRALVGVLRPVSADEWAAAVRAVDPDPDPALLSPTLGDASLPDLTDHRSATTMADTDEVVPPSTSVGTTPVPDPAPTTTAPVDPGAATEAETEAARPLGALYGLAEDDDPGVTPGAFADEVTVGFVGDTTADVVIGDDDLLDGDRWTLELDGRWAQGGPVSILDRLTSANVSAEHPAAPTPTCAGEILDPVEDDLYAYAAVDIDSCLDWFAVVVRVDDEGRIAEVRLRLWEP
ncbi:MAG TPA: hypothetical protein VGO60_09390, partial [Iamia sp.]|nr:hypothetical protein [Iamia sp.]